MKKPACRIFLIATLLLAATSLAVAGELPALAKDTIRARAKIGYYTKVHTWYPELTFQLLGPLPSGAIVWVEYAYPGKKGWAKTDCGEDSNILNQWLVMGCYADKSHATLYTGPVDFTIHLRNELEGTDAVLYKGKFKAVKKLMKSGDLDYFVDEDWRIPIGYVYFNPSDASRGLHAVMWFKGKPGGVTPFLFYQGKEVVKGEGCGAGDASDFDPKAEGWWEVDCEFPGAYEDAKKAEDGYDPKFDMSANPGDYEIKALAGGKLARVIKFKVNADGKIDSTVSAANKLGRERAIVPVELVGNQGVWDAAAYKTGAFYGHPLTGFAAPPPRAAAGPK